MLIDISIGELLDRYSILEIKKNEITDNTKLKYITTELKLYNVHNELIQYNLYYKLLYFVNKQIWDKTNLIKSLINKDEHYANIAYSIFELNQQRFRMKNIINILSNNSINEQKSYQSLNIYITFNSNNYDDIFIKLLYYTLNYDNVYINISHPILSHFPNIIKLDIACINIDDIVISDYEIFKNLYFNFLKES
jgi:hypothetical protein